MFDVAGAVNALSSSLLVDAPGVGVVVVAVAPDDAVAPDALVIGFAFLAPIAMQPARVTIPTTLDTPVILRARRAG